MDIVDDHKIEKLLEDISAIKSVIKENKKLLRQILLPIHFRLMSLILGMSIIVFSLLFFFLIHHYGGYGSIPGRIKTIIYAAMAVDWIFLVILKYSNWLSSLTKIDQKYTLSRALNEFFSYRIIHVWSPLFFLILFLSIYLGTRNSAYYIVPTISIGAGLMYNLFGSITEIRQYLIAGYWFLVTGICPLVFNAIPATIALSVSLGCGMLLFALPIKEG